MKMRSTLRSLAARARELPQDETGVVAPLAIMLLVVLLGFCALALDTGTILGQRRALQNAVDAAALAGAQPFTQSSWSAADVTAAATQWAARNGVASAEITGVTVNPTGKSLPIGQLPTVTVSAQRTVRLTFGPIIGIKQIVVGAQAVAGVVPLQPQKIWPFSITKTVLQKLQQQPPAITDPGLQPGEAIIKDGAGLSSQGNYGLLDLAGDGGKGVDSLILGGGYNGPITVTPGSGCASACNAVPNGTWVVPTDPGNKVAPADDAVRQLLAQSAPCQYVPNDLRCPLVGLVPVVTDDSWANANGQKPVTVINFGVFQLERLVGTNGNGHLSIVASFFRTGTVVGQTDPNGLVNLYGVRLWQ